MNCERIRENLVNSLAARESPLSGELALHVRSCDSCRSFYENESTLLFSIDAGLRIMGKQEMPPSLLPGLRARLSDQPASRSARIPAWSFAAAVAAVVVLFIGVNHLRRQPGAQSNLAASSITAPAPVSNPAPPQQLAPKAKVTQQPVTRKHAKPAIPEAVSAEASSEVIVLAEEREAFARFAAEIPQRQEIALALTKPASAQPGAPVEIALLQIVKMDLAPLNPAVEPGN